MTDDDRNEAAARLFLSSAAEVARLLDLADAADVPEDQRGRHLAHAVRRPLLDYLRSGTDAEQAGAERAWYCAHLPLRADRSPAYAPEGRRDPALDEARDLVGEWLATVEAQVRDRTAPEGSNEN
ncbi:hypothetical protein ABZ922_27075 [Streptomyces shenzhenensis]|uniref:hypothetical protein n=1 Tax=Streptomyces shenzhenensis TaxID=943815 RepID=UPI0033FA6197